MRLSILALFIALPAAAYAAGSPGSQGGQKQGSQADPKAVTAAKVSTDPKTGCTPKYNPCDDTTPCCDDFKCTTTGLDSVGKPLKVCFKSTYSDSR